ncbi:hypothetical protein Tco_0716732 [Tanacetum coccineum]
MQHELQEDLEQLADQLEMGHEQEELAAPDFVSSYASGPRMKATIVTFKLHYGGVLVRGPMTNIEIMITLVFKEKIIGTGVVKLYVEHSEEWLRINNKLVDYDYTTEMIFDQSTWSRYYTHDNEESEQDETTSSEEDDHDEDFEAELDKVVETLSPNQDTEVTDGIYAIREHYKALNQNKLIHVANIPEKELHHYNEENDNSKGSEGDYLVNSDVESLDEVILKDGAT